jgi:ATP diphosphatase
MDDEAAGTGPADATRAGGEQETGGFAPSRDITALLTIMAALRDRRTGCPWDVAQSFASIAPYTIEEAYEVADAIAQGDMRELREELGDLLLQVVFHAQMGSEAGSFDFGDVVEAITGKLIRRHPHVFGATRGANAKFERRFRAMEAEASRAGREMKTMSLDELEALWVAAKQRVG